jgi:hypothetical protein
MSESPLDALEAALRRWAANRGEVLELPDPEDLLELVTEVRAMRAATDPDNSASIERVLEILLERGTRKARRADAVAVLRLIQETGETWIRKHDPDPHDPSPPF